MSATSAAPSELITLASGPTVSLEALRLGWDLEARGLLLERAGERLAVSPVELITDIDRARIREHRDELFALIGHCAREM